MFAIFICQNTKPVPVLVFRSHRAGFIFNRGIMKTEFELELEAIAEFDNEIADEEVEECYQELEKLKMNCGEGQ